MKNQKGEIIYVGKAKRLKDRVSQYFTQAHSGKTQRMVSEVADFDTILTTTEKEALLLEINLIHQYDPRYNILLKDNKSYPYIQITLDQHPMLRIARNAKNKKAKYFGPFPQSSSAYEILDLLNRLFPLRKCHTLPNKPCLYLHMHQCLGPCINEVASSTYHEIIAQITRFMKGDTKDIVSSIRERMMAYAENLEYEQANEQKKLLQSIEHIAVTQNIQFADRIDRDVFGFHERNGYVAIAVLMYRSGVLAAKDVNVFPLYEDVLDAFANFIMQFYKQQTLPREIILPDLPLDTDLIADALDVSIVTPTRGAKSDLIQLVGQNAIQGMDEQFAHQASASQDQLALLDQLGELLDINTPMVIDMIDNSHTGGEDAVSAVVVFQNGQPLKSQYRKYKVDHKGDDVANMKETLYRRYYRKLVEQSPFPDLLLVDGGMTQVRAAQSIIDQLQLVLPVIGVVKDDRHRTHGLLKSTGEEVDIRANKPLFFLITRMQDEVHRFALTFHRHIRSKSQTSSFLDQVPGLGKKRQLRLLDIFGSLKNISQASLNDLAQYIPRSVAEDLLKRLRETEDTYEPIDGGE